MIVDELKYRIHEALGFVPTADQEHAISLFTQFLFDREEQSAFVLRGSAGTGKTTLAAAIVKALLALKQKILLLSPTGRAAKVFSHYAGQPAYTIHRRIYRQQSSVSTDFTASLAHNLHADTLFIVDEASMIASMPAGEGFATHSLLDDLISYVYNGQNCRLLLIGDKAQLPPVGEEEAPALMRDYLAGYGLSVYDCDIDEVLRQSSESGILFNATMIRAMITHDDLTQMPRIRVKGFPDICVVPGNELIEALSSSYSRVGVDETIVITKSNKQANIYNHGIRNTVLDREEELCRGDQLMIVKNNYYWVKAEGEKQLPIAFLANGDSCVVQRVRNIREFYGFRFADVTLQLPDYDDYELTVTALLNTLTSEAPALTREQQVQLYEGVMADYADIPHKTDQQKKVKDDPYYNALQIKFGYAVTCHKAQGGQWAHVYIDQGYMTDEMLTPNYMHWLYTAFTRATEKLFLINWPKKEMETLE